MRFMKIYYYVFALMVCCTYTLQAQLVTDSIQMLDEVVLSDVKLKKYASGYKVTKLKDSIISKQLSSSLTDLLRYNSNIYFRENGYGMISSPSFRGTNASQTAVVWNGININSQLTGQSDFNTLTTAHYDAIEVRHGGGSVQYGSSAIGGTIHLQNDLVFNKHQDHQIDIHYQSFNTKTARYKLALGNQKWSANIGLGYRDSDNDYKYLGTDQRNENGEFDNQNLSFNLGYLISNKDVLKVYHESFFSDRNLSGTLVASSRNRYTDQNFRSLIEWGRVAKNFTSKLRMAHLSERFEFYENRDVDISSTGKVNSFIINHNFDYKVTEAINLRSVIEYKVFNAEGTSFGEPNRNEFSAALLFKQNLGESVSYGIQLRQDINSDFTSPLVFSGDVAYQLSKYYTLKLNASKNYRVPTFNDLYWQPGGNLDLIPESSIQFDLGHVFKYNNMRLGLNAYYIKTKDMIQWLPNVTGIWSPQNINRVESYGTEVEFNAKLKKDNHVFESQTNYAYTVSEDTATSEQLIYVPFHKVTSSLAYNYKSVFVFYQHLFNGKVRIIGGDLSAFDIGNFGIGYKLKTSNKLAYQLQFNINNIYNSYYENVALRPMPNRNYQLELTLKL